MDEKWSLQRQRYSSQVTWSTNSGLRIHVFGFQSMLSCFPVRGPRPEALEVRPGLEEEVGVLGQACVQQSATTSLVNSADPQTRANGFLRQVLTSSSSRMLVRRPKRVLSR